MPWKRRKKSRSTPQRLAVAEASANPSKMLEAEEPRSPSPSRSRSPSPSASLPLVQPQEQHPESKEEAQEPLQGMEAERQEQPPQDAGEEDSQGAAASPPLVPVAAADTRVAAPTPSSHRMPPGKRGKPLPDKQRAVIKEKLDLLEKNLRPVAFAPGKAIDFARHERLFRALGLWDFVHADLGCPIRTDLLTQLIANYDHSARRSWVNGARIAVTRPDLARALGLQWKKDKASVSESKDADHDLFLEEGSIAVIMDFMSNWVLFPEEDACILPGDVMAATQLLKEGQPQKVDWSALIWMMVEKELLEVPTSGSCYYASHLQRLMRHQKPGIFEGEEQDVMEVPMAEDDDDVNALGVSGAVTLQDSGLLDAEKQGAGLCLALGGDEDILKVNNEECQENEQDQWCPGTKNVDSEHYLRPCNLNSVESMQSEVVAREVGMGEEGRYVDDITAKFSNLDRMAPTDLLQAMDSVNVTYCLPMQPIEPSSGEFLVSRSDPLKSVELDTCMGGSSLFKMASKREIDDIDDDDDGDGITRFSHVNHQKKMRTEGQWDQTPLTIEKCMDEAHAWMGRAKVFVSQREQDFVSAQMHIQYISNLLQEKDQQIQFLEKTRLEEEDRRQMVICRFEHELGVMARIVQGYRKALMDTRRAFAEYRKQFPQGDEQLYKDDDDGGGLVTTAKELERKRLCKEEARSLAVHICDDFNRKWLERFKGYEDQVHQLGKRLLDLMGESNLLKERLAKSNVSAEKE
uniref:Uncharacterized protein n=1 Tax=Anthurium amnicola TaxID=1678845 RepID=A0A1D1Z2T4_9ARAE